MSDEETNFQENPDVKVEITKGGAPSLTVEDVGMMLWLEGFSRPMEPGRDGALQYAVVTKTMIEAVLKLYNVDVPANIIIRWLRQVGLIQYADALSVVGGPMVFRYTCARAARDKEPTTLDEVAALIYVIAEANERAAAIIGPRPEDPRDAQREAQEIAEAKAAEEARLREVHYEGEEDVPR